MVGNPHITETHEFGIHGGRLHAARLYFPDAPLPWLDLSTGINPTAYPFNPADIDHRALPDSAKLQELLDSATAAFGIQYASLLTAVPGSEAGLRALTLLLGKKRIALGEPTYSSHRNAWAAAGVEVISLSSSSSIPIIQRGPIIHAPS